MAGKPASKAAGGLSEAVHLAVLWGLAVAQPIYDLLARHSGFFVVRRLAVFFATFRFVTLRFAVFLATFLFATLRLVFFLATFLFATLRLVFFLATFLFATRRLVFFLVVFCFFCGRQGGIPTEVNRRRSSYMYRFH